MSTASAPYYCLHADLTGDPVTDTPLDACTRCGHVRIAHHDLDYITSKCARGGCSCRGYTTAPPPTVQDVIAVERRVEVAAAALARANDYTGLYSDAEAFMEDARAVVAALDALGTEARDAD